MGRGLAATAIAALLLTGAARAGSTTRAGAGTPVAGTTPAAGSPPGGSMCRPVPPAAHPRAVSRLRVGVDPGAAGNPVPSARPPKPVSRPQELRALRGLRPARHVLVVRLNRLFWSGGDPLLHRFARHASRYARAGFDVEVQVRYHPTKQEEGRIPAWRRWVRHVTRVLDRNRRLVSLTVTNEVNFAISPNTSDGSYSNARQALVAGVEAAHRQLTHDHRARRVRVGFTFAYRLNPSTDASLFTYLRDHGGRKFRRALGFVGLDDYPGTVYPPTLQPGDSAGHELAGAIATMRRCYLRLGGIGRSTPLWVTENGFPSNSPQHTEGRQRQQLRSMVTATRRVAGTYHVTDYRWFNLRDNDSSGNGMFDQDGLLRDSYAAKPSYAVLRAFIRHHGRRTGRANR